MFVQPRWLWILISSAILTQTGVQLVRPVTSYQLLSLSAGETEIGVATSLFALLPLFFAMPAGRLAGRVADPRWLIISGAVLLAGGGALLAVGQQVWVILSGSAVLGMGHLLFTLTGQSIISARAASHTMDAAFGWFTAAFSVGQMIGPLLSGLILGLNSGQLSASGVPAEIRWALWVGTALNLVAIPLLLALSPQPPRVRGATGTGKNSQNTTTASLPVTQASPTVMRILQVPGVPSHMMVALSLLVMIDILVAFMPLVGEQAGVSPLVVGILLSIRGAASVVCRILLPVLSRRFYRNVLVVASVGVSAITFAAVPLVLDDSVAGIFISAVLMAVGGFFLGLGQPLTMTQIAQAVPVNWRSSALALRLVGNRLGQVLVPLAAGALAAPWGAGAGIWFASGLLGLSTLERLFASRLGPDPDEQGRRR